MVVCVRVCIHAYLICGACMCMCMNVCDLCLCSPWCAGVQLLLLAR